MPEVLFRQSDVTDPFALYAEMLAETPVYFDDARKIWAIYSYAGCRQILQDECAFIPDPNQAVMVELNEPARLLAETLIRLQNPPRHTAAHPLVLRLFEQCRPDSTESLLDNIIAPAGKTFDFVETIARRLPALSLLNGFGFTPGDTEFLLSHLDTLVKIMLPGKSAQTIEEVNRVVAEIFPRVEQHIRKNAHLQVSNADKLPVLVVNLIGLVIQSYDAGRGILSNVLLQYARQSKSAIGYGHFVTETLRYDPPVHNTRRLLTRAAIVHDVEIGAGETVLLVLAAANRDPAVFANPTQFDSNRANNDAHLTFGAGAHECLARHYIGKLAAETLQYFAEKHPNLRIITEDIEHEPLVNVRLPRKIEITL